MNSNQRQPHVDLGSLFDQPFPRAEFRQLVQTNESDRVDVIATFMSAKSKSIRFSKPNAATPASIFKPRTMRCVYRRDVSLHFHDLIAASVSISSRPMIDLFHLSAFAPVSLPASCALRSPFLSDGRPVVHWYRAPLSRARIFLIALFPRGIAKSINGLSSGSRSIISCWTWAGLTPRHHPFRHWQLSPLGIYFLSIDVYIYLYSVADIAVCKAVLDD